MNSTDLQLTSSEQEELVCVPENKWGIIYSGKTKYSSRSFYGEDYYRTEGYALCYSSGEYRKLCGLHILCFSTKAEAERAIPFLISKYHNYTFKAKVF